LIVNQNGDIAIRFGMPGLRIKVNSLILPILTINWLPWQRPLSDRKKTVKSAIYDQIPTKNENLAKIGLVDPEIICLKGLF